MKMVGTGRFELPTPRTPSECSTRLSHVPTTTGYWDSLQDCASSGTRLRRKTRKSMAGWDVFLGQVGPFAEEVLGHLFDEELLRLRGPGLEAVFVEEHLLMLQPFGPGFSGDVLVNLLAKVAVEGRLFEAFHFLLITGAKDGMRHSFLFLNSLYARTGFSVRSGYRLSGTTQPGRIDVRSGAGSAGGGRQIGSGFGRHIADSAGLFAANGRDVLRHLVGVADAVNDGDGGEDGENPQHRGHDSPAVEERAQDDEDDALGTLHEAHLALADQGLGAGAGVADHERSDHDEGREEDVKEAIAARVKNEESEEEDNVGVAVDDGIEEGSEDGDFIGLAGDAAVDHVKDAGGDDDQGGIQEETNIVAFIGEAKEDGGAGVDDESDEGEDVGRDAGERETVDDGLEENSAGAAEGAGPCRCHETTS